MGKGQAQFQIVVLEAETQSHSYTIPGAWGQDITSSAPADFSIVFFEELAIKILPRANESEVDPSTLKIAQK